MITNVNLSFARLVQTNVSENYIFAKTEKPMKHGEITSDFLGFFGFGSGASTGRRMHDGLEHYHLLLFPVDKDYVKASSILQQLFDVMSHNYYFEPADIQKGFLFLAAAYNKSYTKNLSNIESLGLDVLMHVHPLFSYGTDQEGNKFFAVGFDAPIMQHHHLVDYLERYGVKSYPISKFPFFNWDNWIGVSTSKNAQGIFGAMRRMHFMCETHDLQNTYISNLETEAMRMLTFG